MNLHGWEVIVFALCMWTVGAFVGGLIVNGINERRNAERRAEEARRRQGWAGMVNEARGAVEDRAPGNA